MSKRVNRTELAKEIGKSAPYITKLVKSGKLVFDDDNKIDLDLALNQIKKNVERVKSDHEEKSTDVVDEKSLNYYKTLTEKYKSEDAAIDLAIKRGEYISKQVIAVQAIMIANNLRETLRTIPERIGTIVCSEAIEKNESNIRNIIRKEVDDAVNEAIEKLGSVMKK